MSKKILFTYLLILVVAAFVGCEKGDADKKADLNKMKSEFTKEVKFDKPKTESLKDNKSVAERFGLPLDKIEDGFAYWDDADKVGEIVVVKSKERLDVVDVERALESEIGGISDAWENVDEKEFKKVREHILRTDGLYTLLAITDDNKKVEKMWEKHFE